MLTLFKHTNFSRKTTRYFIFTFVILLNSPYIQTYLKLQAITKHSERRVKSFNTNIYFLSQNITSLTVVPLVNILSSTLVFVCFVHFPKPCIRQRFFDKWSWKNQMSTSLLHYKFMNEFRTVNSSGKM